MRCAFRESSKTWDFQPSMLNLLSDAAAYNKSLERTVLD